MSPREKPIEQSQAALWWSARWPLGGIRTHLQYNFPLLTAAGYHCTFVGPDDGSLPVLREGLERIATADYVAVPTRGSRCRLWSAVRRLLRLEPFDILHSHGLTAACHCEFGRLGMKVPHIATMHEPLRPQQFGGWLGAWKRWAMGRLLRRADALVTVSDDSYENLVDSLPALRASAEKILTLPNGIDVDRFAAPPRPVKTLRKQIGLSPEIPLVGYLGRYMPEKGFSLLIEAAHRLITEPEGTAFHVVAIGSGDCRRDYQKQIDVRGIGGYFTLLDFVPDVAPILPQLDLVVVPSLWEASPLVPMEAMCAGVPVLGSDCTGLREVLCGTPSRSFRRGDADSLRLMLRGRWSRPGHPQRGPSRRRRGNASTTASPDDVWWRFTNVCAAGPKCGQ